MKIEVMADGAVVWSNIATQQSGYKDLEPGVQAYERPEMLASDPQLIADGVTVNADGSIWQTSQGEKPRGGNVVVAGTKRQVVYGHISPQKTPELWALAKKILDAETFKNWEAEWERDPYGVYSGNPAKLAAQGLKVDFMLFNYALAKITSVKQ